MGSGELGAGRFPALCLGGGVIVEYMYEEEESIMLLEEENHYGSHYRNLKVWKKAHEVVLEIYKMTNDFPEDERFGLTSQLRRAVVSIPTNLAEGYGRTTSADFKRFVMISLGSANEVEYLLLLCKDLGYISKEYYRHFNEKIIQITKMLYGLKKAIEAKLRG